MLRDGYPAIDARIRGCRVGCLFHDPLHRRVDALICIERHRNRPVTPDAVKALLAGDSGLAQLSPDYLESLALGAPSIISADDLDHTVHELVRHLLAHQADEIVTPPFSDDALALTLAQRHADHLRYVAETARWMSYNGQRWIEEKTRNIFELSREVCRDAAEIAAGGNGAPKAATGIASAKTVAAVERLARSDRLLAASADQWDLHEDLLNTPGGVIDLTTGKVRAHRSNRYMTKMTAVAPGGDCPLFMKFLNRITNGDVELQRFLARVFGYALTGSTKEHALFFFFGTGANGKSVLLETVSGILGDYAQVAPMETFTASKTDRHPTELADLEGARLVTASETEEGRVFAEARIKSLTGGDKIKARKMRQDFHAFVPQFKLIIAGNHKPAIKAVDEAMKRRVNLTPFTVTIPQEERDPDLVRKLKAEWPGILHWMIKGCLEWQNKGLSPPKAVTAATADYLEGEDTVIAWIAEYCRIGAAYRQKSSQLYESFKRYAEAAGEDAGSNKAFSARLEAHGFKKARRDTGVIFSGIALIPNMTGGP
jgi:putative DNA primase/helicase